MAPPPVAERTSLTASGAAPCLRPATLAALSSAALRSTANRLHSERPRGGHDRGHSTPPAPRTTIRAELSDCSTSTTAPAPVYMLHPNGAAATTSTSSFTMIRFRGVTSAYVAKLDCPKKDTRPVSPYLDPGPPSPPARRCTLMPSTTGAPSGKSRSLCIRILVFDGRRGRSSIPR